MQVGGDLTDAAQRFTAFGRQAEQSGQLRNDDMDRNAGQKTGGDRHRQKVGDPAEPEDSAQTHQQADHQRQHRRQRQIMRRAGNGDECEAAGKKRCDGRIRAGRQMAVGAEQGKAQRSRDKGEEADLGRKAAKPRRRHLFGNGDCRQRQPCGQIAIEIPGPPTAQRSQRQPPGPVHRDRGSRPGKTVHRRLLLWRRRNTLLPNRRNQRYPFEITTEIVFGKVLGTLEFRAGFLYKRSVIPD
jgi:hypothetical protein